MFAPEYWGTAERFSKLYQHSYAFRGAEQRAVSGVCAHFDKAITLRSLAEKLAPNLDLDEAEFAEKGFTPAANSRELSAVVEAVILELYAVVDCTAQVLKAAYPSVRGFKKSVRGLFSDFEKFGEGFPESLKDALRAVTWYDELRFLRDELTHLTPGACHRDRDRRIVSYMHPGIMRGDRALILDDIFAWVDAAIANVNGFTGLVFAHLNTTLKPTPVQQICGVFAFRIFMRAVNPTEPLTFNSGTCISHQWFELPENPSCPFAPDCGAYARRGQQP
ncbi:MAG: hypothetical protein JSR45_07600 [Proteobacteria bacterium]|nr:hypothetical protein [Pseudomonadota bacterium]